MSGCVRCCRRSNAIVPEDGAQPLRLRECRDTPFLIGYIFVAASLVSIGWYGFQNCTAAYFVRGADSWGNVCGGDPNSLPAVDGLEKFAQLKVESTNVWRQECIGKSVRLCVKECPTLPLNSTTCEDVLKKNAYDSNQVAWTYCEDECFSQHQGNATVLIVNRCLREERLAVGHVLIKDYVNLLHYVINDVTSTVEAGGSIFAFVLVGSILVNVLTIRHPEYASVCCFASSLAITTLFSVFAAFSIHSAAADLSTELRKANYDVPRLLMTSYTTVYSLTALLSCISLIYIICTLVLTRKDFRKARGLWLSASKCFSANPKILSQPLLTLFTCAGATFFLILVTFSVFGCQTLQHSSTSDTVIYEDKSLPWLMLPAVLCYTWFVRLCGKGQSAVLSGAAADWYFTKRNHPITFSLRSLLKYNLGSFVAVTFSGKLIEVLLRLLARKCPDSPVLPYFASQVAISIGVYGEVREFCLEEKDCVDENIKPVFRGYRLVRSALFSWKMAVTEISTFLLLVWTAKTRIFIPIVPVVINGLVTWQVCGVFTACMEETIAGISVSIYEDFKRNNGKRKPYFCDRKVAHLIYGMILPLTSTRYGRQRISKQEERSKLIKDKVTNMASQNTLVHKFVNNARRNTRESERYLLRSRGSIRSQVKISKIQLARSAILKKTSYVNRNIDTRDDEIISYVSLEELEEPEDRADTPMSSRNGSITTPTKNRTISRLSSKLGSNDSDASSDTGIRPTVEFPKHSEKSIKEQNSSKLLVTSTDTKGISRCQKIARILPSTKEEKRDEIKIDASSDTVELPKHSERSIKKQKSSKLVTFTDTRGISRWQKIDRLLPSTKEGKRDEVKIIRTVRTDDDEDEIWKDWW